jgi:hypothetical protein
MSVYRVPTKHESRTHLSVCVFEIGQSSGLFDEPFDDILVAVLRRKVNRSESRMRVRFIRERKHGAVLFSCAVQTVVCSADDECVEAGEVSVCGCSSDQVLPRREIVRR